MMFVILFKIKKRTKVQDNRPVRILFHSSDRPPIEKNEKNKTKKNTKYSHFSVIEKPLFFPREFLYPQNVN